MVAVVVGFLVAVLDVAAPTAAGALDTVELVRDPDGRLSAADALTAPAERVDPRRSLGFTTDVLWLRLRVRVPDGSHVLVVETSQLDEVDAHICTADQLVVHRAGDRRPVAERPLRAHHFAFPLPGATDVTVALRIRSEGSIRAPLSLRPAAEFAAQVERDQLVWSLALGFLAALVLYNLFLFTAVRDGSYLWYGAYLATFALFQASLAGYTALHLWPATPAWAHVAPAFFLALAVAASLLFVRRMLALAQLAPRLYRAMGVVAAAAAGLAPALMVAFPWAVRAIAGLATISVPLLLVPMGLAVRHGYRPARYVVAAYSALVPGAMLLALVYFGALPANPVADYALPIGTAVEALLLSFALADRIAHERDQVSRRLVEAQDGERRRIAAELHDGLGQGLAVLANRLRPLSAEATALAEDLVAEVRGVSQELHPHRLDRLGLTAAMRASVDEALAASGLEGGHTIDDVEALLPPGAALHLYRILQEAIANVLRHAAATELKVSFVRVGDKVRLLVEDDGAGLGRAPRPSKGLGLHGMEERARLVGGRLVLRAAPGGGTVVEVELPLPRGRA